MNELVKLHKCKLTETSLVIQNDISFDEWMGIGNFLKQVNKCVLWWLGDWLNFGENKYGEKYSQALEETDYSYSGLSNAAWVANKIETSRRRENLSWSHHAEVAGLSEEKQDIFLGKALDKTLSVMDLRKEIKRPNDSIPIKDIPKGQYNLIYCDPPWRYEFPISDSRKIENQYPTLTLLEIKELNPPAADNSVLLMWATAPKLYEALEVMSSWGFNYRSCAVWDKEKMGMGYWFRIQHELLLVGIKGEFSPPIEKNRIRSIISEPRGKHSQKPMVIYSIIENMFPESKKIELFARQKRKG